MSLFNRKPPPPSTHTPIRFVATLSNGKELEISRTKRGAIQLRMRFGSITYPGPEFDEKDLSLVVEALQAIAARIAEESNNVTLKKSREAE